MNVVPRPNEEDVAFNDPYTVELEDGEEAEVTFSPEQSGSTFYLATVAISKIRGTIFELEDDQTPMYGPANIPPTDIDDLTITWAPCKQFEDSLTVYIRNFTGSAQTYHIQPIGFERADGGGQSGA